MLSRRFLAGAIVALAAAEGSAAPHVESHAIECSFDPAKSTIDAIDRMAVVRESGGPLVVFLNKGLAISQVSVDGVATSKIERVADDGWLVQWRIQIPEAGAA